VNNAALCAVLFFGATEHRAGRTERDEADIGGIPAARDAERSQLDTSMAPRRRFGEITAAWARCR
jgi:hypothetical protein